MTDTRRTGLPLDDGHRTWDVLAERLDALIRRWDADQAPPPLAEFLPPGSPALRRLVLTELVKVDLAYRWARGRPKRLEEYVAEFPELRGPSGLPCDLIFEEYQARRRAGDAVGATEYRHRFPDQATEIARLLGGAVVTTVGSAPKVRPTDIDAGQKLDDFDLLALLGEGAFARVFLARQRSMQRVVALKVSADRGAEPQTLAQLDHPHIVRVYDQRVLEADKLRLLYMPYLPGGTLRDVLLRVRDTPPGQRSGRLVLAAVDAALAERGETPPTDSPTRQRLAGMTWPEAVCWLGGRLAEALDYAHRKGVLHRDVKPANVLLGADAAPRLADFNVSSCTKVEGAGPAAFFGGSIGYMSPEQMEAFNPAHERDPASLDARTDVYSLAVTLWELLAGVRPFPDEEVQGDWPATLAALVERRRAGITPVALARLPLDLPPGLRDVLQTALAADRDRRYPTAAEFARQLDLCLKPATRELLHPEPGWRTWVRRHPMVALYPMGLVSNVVASLLSIEFNRAAIVHRFLSGHPRALAWFEHLQLIVNGAFFPLGLLLFAVVAWPVVWALRAGAPAADLPRVRRRCLQMGPGSVLVSLWGWVAAGVIFPLVLHLAARGEVPPAFHVHFLLSQTLFGLIAVTYPQFAVTWLAVRGLYPALLPGAALGADDAARLRRLERSLGWFLVLAASVPMLAAGMLAMTELDGLKMWLGLVSAIGVAGFGLAYYLTTLIRADIAALLELTGDRA